MRPSTRGHAAPGERQEARPVPSFLSLSSFSAGSSFSSAPLPVRSRYTFNKFRGDLRGPRVRVISTRGGRNRRPSPRKVLYCVSLARRGWHRGRRVVMCFIYGFDWLRVTVLMNSELALEAGRAKMDTESGTSVPFRVQPSRGGWGWNCHANCSRYSTGCISSVCDSY